MTGGNKYIDLRLLNILMSADKYFTTKQLMSKLDCGKHSIYRTIDTLEINGFSIDVRRNGKNNEYRYKGLYGRDE